MRGGNEPVNGTTPPQEAVHQRYVLSVLVRHILAMTMALCMALAILDVASLLGGGLHVELIVVLCLLVSIEAMYAYHVLTHVSAYGRNWVLYRVSEWVVILVGLKAALYFTRGFDQFALDLLSWQQDFTHFFMDGEFVIGILILAVVWGLSTLFAHDLDELDVDPRRLEVERQAGLHIERASSRQQLTDHVLIAGGAMVLLMALSKLPVLLRSGGVPSPEPVPFYAVLYFAAGLGLFGITQFTLLRTGWLWDRLKISSGLGWRWLAYGAVFLAAALVVALLLPTGYSVGLLGALGYLISLLVTLFQVLFFLVLQLLFLVASLIASLLGQPAPEQPTAPVQPALPPPPPPQTPTASEPWLEVVKSVIFLGAAAGNRVVFAVPAFTATPGLVDQVARIARPAETAAGLATLVGRAARAEPPVRGAHRCRLAGAPDFRSCRGGETRPGLREPAAVIAAPASHVLLPGDDPARQSARPGAQGIPDAVRVCEQAPHHVAGCGRGRRGDHAGVRRSALQRA